MTSERWELIKAVFAEVLESPSASRGSCLSELCSDDHTLRLEVEELLRAHEQGEGFMARPLIAELVMEPLPEIPSLLRSGEVISRRFLIVRLIGEGGMGQVYECQDLEIGAKVALKTIRPDIASDDHTLSRFRQELHLNRRITHPNVCRAFDIAHDRISRPGEEDSEITYITMELLGGETLAAWIRRGRMSPAAALPLIRQMVEALDAAHSVGVVHRDFKPSNVMLCPVVAGSQEAGTRVVVTDFGLARSYSANDGSASLTHSGQLIGTLAYMAPEQAEGKEASPATDIYSLGLVIYEMVTGQRPFPGDGPFAGVIERLKQAAPTPKLLVPDLNGDWEYTILRCLERDPNHRFKRAAEVSEALSGVRNKHLPVPRPFLDSRRQWAIFSMVFLAFLLIAITSGWLWMRRQPASSELRSAPILSSRLEMTQFTADGSVTFQPGISRDGKYIVYSSDRDSNGILNIWMQDKASLLVRRVTNETVDAIEPDLSPDNSRIAFRSEREGAIYMISSDGQNRRRIANNGHHPKFSPDGSWILYWSGDWIGDFSNPSFALTSRIYVVSARGGPTHQLQAQFADARLPIWLPDGKRILFLGTRSANVAGSAMSQADWWIADLTRPQDPPMQTHAFELIHRHGIVVQDFVPGWWKDSIIFSGRFSQSINLFRVRLSPQDFQPVGEPERLTTGTAYETTPSVSSSGNLFFTGATAQMHIWSVPLVRGETPGARTPVKLTSAASVDTRPSISHDGTKLVFARRWGSDRNVWLRDLKTGTEMKLTSSTVTTPLISPDGLQVAYSTFPDPGKANIEIYPVAGGSAKSVCNDCGDPLDWTSDSAGLMYETAARDAIMLLDIRSGRKTILLRSDSGLNFLSAGFCPGDRCIVFSESLDGTHSQLWLAPFSGHYPIPRANWLALTSGEYDDDKPRWSADGRWLFFASDRDGAKCIWRLRFDPATRHPRGQPAAFLHLHQAGFSLRELSRAAFDIRIAGDKLVFNADSYAANIWATDLAEK